MRSRGSLGSATVCLLGVAALGLGGCADHGRPGRVAPRAAGAPVDARAPHTRPAGPPDAAIAGAAGAEAVVADAAVTAPASRPAERPARAVATRSVPLPPPSAACRGRAARVSVAALREPRVIAPRLLERCATLRGWWGVGAVLVPEPRAGVAGFRVIRPFSFVRERNPSLGWPSWYALDAVLADCGWRAADAVGAVPVRDAAFDAMFEEPVTVHGVLRRADARTARELWAALNALAATRAAGPYGNTLLPVVVQLHAE